MVVCKCRKATRLYCFVHRNPVCLDCICAPGHEHCVVAQYSDWVNDGDYDWPPTCPVCNESLEDSDKPTVRLGCLHVPHAQCLQQHLESFPVHTAPAGYTCPATGCHAAVWPPKHQKDASSTLYTNMRTLISATTVADALLKAPIPASSLASSSREASTNDLTAYAGRAANQQALPSDGAPGPLLNVQSGSGQEAVSIPEAASPQKSSQGIAAASPQGPTARSRASQHSVAVDVQEAFSKDATKGYSADEDEGERKYARRGPAHVQFLRYLGSFWSPALHALPVTNPRKDKDDLGDEGEHRLRRAKSSKAALDPRKLLLGLAIGSCMATMLLLYYRLAQGSISSGGMLP